MRNPILIGIAAVVVLTLGVALLWCATPAPAPATPAPAVSLEAQRAQEIRDEVRRGNVGHARALADEFYRAYPRSAEIADIERLTGYHPRPYGPSK